MEALPDREKTVVVIDDDRDLAELVQTVLLDEGFAVTCLYVPDQAAIKAAIDRIEPACVILDGGGRAEFGPSWEVAAWLASRQRPVPTVMFTAHEDDREEAIVNETARAKQAKIAATIPKPFDIDQLIEAVHTAIGVPVPTRGDQQEEAHRAELLRRLQAAGAHALTSSHMGRTWATFRIGTDPALYKVYRWRAANAFFVGRYSADGSQMQPLGQFGSIDALIAYCMAALPPTRPS